MLFKWPLKPRRATRMGPYRRQSVCTVFYGSLKYTAGAASRLALGLHPDLRSGIIFI